MGTFEVSFEVSPEGGWQILSRAILHLTTVFAFTQIMCRLSCCCAKRSPPCCTALQATVDHSRNQDKWLHFSVFSSLIVRALMLTGIGVD